VVVRAVHQASGNTFEGVTDERGGYRLPVRTGVYVVSTELQGFSSPVGEGIEVLVGQIVVVNFQLTPGDVTETIAVTGETPLDFSQSRLRTTSDSGPLA